MKINNNLVAAAGLALAVATAADAEAGLFNRDRSKHVNASKRTERTADQERPRRFERIPEMSFVRGNLSLASPGQWLLNGLPLVVREDCVMIREGQAITVLEEGLEVMVTGAGCEAGMEAWGIEVLPLFEPVAAPDPERKVAVSDSDPSVGEIIFSPY